MLGETTFNPLQLRVLDKQLQRSVVAHGVLGVMVPHQKTGPQCSQNCTKLHKAGP